MERRKIEDEFTFLIYRDQVENFQDTDALDLPKSIVSGAEIFNDGAPANTLEEVTKPRDEVLSGLMGSFYKIRREATSADDVKTLQNLLQEAEITLEVAGRSGYLSNPDLSDSAETTIKMLQNELAQALAA